MKHSGHRRLGRRRGCWSRCARSLQWPAARQKPRRCWRPPSPTSSCPERCRWPVIPSATVADSNASMPARKAMTNALGITSRASPSETRGKCGMGKPLGIAGIGRRPWQPGDRTQRQLPRRATMAIRIGRKAGNETAKQDDRRQRRRAEADRGGVDRAERAQIHAPFVDKVDRNGAGAKPEKIADLAGGDNHRDPGSETGDHRHRYDSASAGRHPHSRRRSGSRPRSRSRAEDR